MDIKVWIDLSQLKRELPKLQQEMDRVVQQSMDEVIQRVYNESQNLVPVKTGALKRSGRIVKRPINSHENPYAYVEYGDGTVDYAVVVHEDLEAHHAEGTQAKYVEVPLARNEYLLGTLIKERLSVLLARYSQ